MREGFSIFGVSYDTEDGTCVRDYIHVLDLADAHIRALEYLLAGNLGQPFNLGTGTGTSVKQLVETIRVVTGKAFPVGRKPPREGDSPRLVANNEKAKMELGWTPKYSMEDILSDAWNWHQASYSQCKDRKCALR